MEYKGLTTDNIEYNHRCGGFYEAGGLYAGLCRAGSSLLNEITGG